MKTTMSILTVLLAAFPAMAQPPAPARQNPIIQPNAFQQSVSTALKDRRARLLDEEAFLKAMREPGVVVLDARSADKYRLRHVAGAVNLPYTDFTSEALAKVLPNKNTKVLIYCNNNFAGDPLALAAKSAGSSLNLPTHAALVDYGYRNVYELRPLLDVAKTRIPFAGALVKSREAGEGS